jgi:hypothetical protein
MYKKLPFLALIFLLFAFQAKSQMNAIVFNGSGQSPENKLIALTLAGIVNRDLPHLYLVNVYETWSYSQTDEMWMEIYSNDGNVNFTEITDINQLVQFFSSYIDGAITYDPSLTYGNFSGQNFRWQAEVAAMIGGLTNCIPLPWNNQTIIIDQPDSVWVFDHFHGQEPLKISAKLESNQHSWNNTSLSQEQRYFSILNWALENLLSRTNPKKFYLREITDWAVSQRMFQLNLAGTESLQFASLSTEKAEKIEQLMTYMQASYPDEIFHVYGWMRPEPLVQWVSAWGGSFHETLLSNLSWHHVFPVDENFDYQRASEVSYDEIIPEDKYYVIFIGSEGDAGNWNAGFQAGAWHSAARGNVPLGWGFNLHFFREFPFLGQYYFRTATANDGFIAVTTPLGYAYTDMFPENYLPNAKEETLWKVQKYGIPSTYAYKHYNGAGISDFRGITISNNYNFYKLGQFAETTGTELTFLFDPALSTQEVYTQYGSLLFNHVNDNTFYGNVTDLNTTAQNIINKLKNKTRPGFLLAGYQRLRQDGTSIGSGNPADITLPRLEQLMNLIKTDPEIGDKIEFVTPERFTWLIKKSILEASVEVTESKATVWVNVNSYKELMVQINTDHYEKYSIKIYDLAGRLVTEKNGPDKYKEATCKIPLSGLQSGMYIVQVNSGLSQISKKIVF